MMGRERATRRKSTKEMNRSTKEHADTIRWCCSGLAMVNKDKSLS